MIIEKVGISEVRADIESITPVYKHHNNTIRLAIQYKAAITSCEHK